MSEAQNAISQIEGRRVKARRWAIDFMVVMSVPLLCGFLGAQGGRDLNWDQINYHVYIAHAFLQNRIALDFNAASVQSYLNPLAHIPFYWAATGASNSWTGAFLLGALQGLSLSFLYVAARLATNQKAPISSHVMSGSVVAIGLAHPVVLAELGSSLVEINASIPFVAALCAFYAAVRSDRPRAKRTWVCACFALVGISIALKLSFVYLAVALPLVLTVVETGKERLRCALLGGVCCFAGWFVGGGFWHLRVFAEFGNPFFPFFNNVFRSPDFPSVALLNDRFVNRSIVDVVTLPWRMLSDHRFVTTERVVIDPRYAVILCLCVAALWLTWRRRAQWTKEAKVFVGIFIALFAAWAMLSGNGRYAVPLHLASGLAVAQLSLVIWHERVQDKIVLIVALVCVAGTMWFGAAAHWTRLPHTQPWHPIDVPESAKVADGLYLSAGYFDRSSNSLVVPWLPPTARFVNVNGYSNPAPSGPGGRRIKEMIAAHTGSLRLVVENQVVLDIESFAAESELLAGLNRNLAGFGVQLMRPENCVALKIWPTRVRLAADSEPFRFASVCPLERVEAYDARIEMRSVDAAFDLLERSMPDRLYPATSESYWRGKQYCRFYPPLEYYLCDDGRFIILFRVDPNEVIVRRESPRKSHRAHLPPQSLLPAQ